VLALLLVVRLLWEWLWHRPVMLACDAPLGVGIVVGGTATLVMVMALTPRTGYTPSVVGISPPTVRTGDSPSGVVIIVVGAAALGMAVAPVCDTPLGVGIVVGGTTALGIFVARKARTGDTPSGVTNGTDR
jgi:pantoate kinase